MSNKSNSPKSSGQSSSSHSSSSSSSSHHSSSHGKKGGSPRKHTDESVTTEVRGHNGPTTVVSGKAEVLVRTSETWDYEGLKKLEVKIATEQAAMIDAEKLLNDQTTLHREALETKERRFADAQRLDKLVTEKAAERDRLLNEEKELELKRAAAHNKAVEFESLRTETLAQAVLAKEEAKVADSLAIQRTEGIKQAKAVADAHRLAIQKLEEHRMELRKKEINVSVKGEQLPQPRAVDINVNVKPLDLPEARVESHAVSQGADAQSHMQENLPIHSKTVVAAKEVQVSEHHTQKTTERHIVSQKDKTVL